MTEHSTGPAAAAQLLLDLLASYDETASSEVNQLAGQTAFGQLNHVGAVRARMTDRGVLEIDMTNLLGAFGFIGGLLITAVADAHGLDRPAVVATLRNRVEQDLQ